MPEALSHSHSPVTAYHYRQGEFQGPLETLLELINQRKMEISSVALSEVTQDFLGYLDRLRSAMADAGDANDIPILVDFIHVASRLILLKSKYLLPDFPLEPEEERSLIELEQQLKLYGRIKPLTRSFGALWKGRRGMYTRPLLRNVFSGAPSFAEPRFLPGSTLTISALHERAARLFSYISKTVHEQALVAQTIVSLEEHIQAISARLAGIEQTSLARLHAAGDKSQAIVTFLAILHMARDQVISLEQSVHFSDILIKRATATVPDSDSTS